MVHIWNNLDKTLKTAKSISTPKFYLKNLKQIDYSLFKYYVMTVF